jgi:hypothetical protein
VCDDCERSLNPQARNRLARHRANYLDVKKHPFEHFFCPILFEDTATALSRGHVINDAFKGSPGAWVMQRTDVDCFYGGAFEGDFLLSQRLKEVRPWDHFFDGALFDAVRPIITYQGQEIKYFLWQPKSQNDVPPTGYSIVELSHGARSIELCIRDAGPEVIQNTGYWDISTRKDLRLQAFVSLLKAAHLSMFSMFGYYYALSNAGRFMGEDILGRFYKQATPLVKKRKIQQSALGFFRRYQNIIQYSIPSVTILEGTLVDGYVNVCATASGMPWGMIVFVKIQDSLMAALLPFPGDASAFAIYLDFLQNDHEKIHVMVGQFNKVKGKWTFWPERHEVVWLKGLDSYPRSIA